METFPSDNVLGDALVEIPEADLGDTDTPLDRGQRASMAAVVSSTTRAPTRTPSGHSGRLRTMIRVMAVARSAAEHSNLELARQRRRGVGVEQQFDCDRADWVGHVQAQADRAVGVSSRAR